MDVLSSAPVTLWVNFEAPQGLVIPDVGSVTYSLLDGAGAPLAVLQALTPEANATGVSIPIQAIHNVITPGRVFERRIVLVNWIADGASHQARTTYRVIEPPLYSATPQDVRTFLSLNSDELRDDEVDLFSAYVTLAAAVGQTTLDEALNAGTQLELRAERALVLTAAIALFPSLRYRIAQSKTDGTRKFDRLKDDQAFSDLVAYATGELGAIMGELTGTDDIGTLAPVLVRLTTITVDPVTGSAPAVTVGG